MEKIKDKSYEMNKRLRTKILSLRRKWSDEHSLCIQNQK